MFESNTDLDFGADFTVDFETVERGLRTKRALATPRDETPKKLKVINVVQRKFPGPAGLLPELLDKENQEVIPCSQMSVSAFQSSPWLDATRDYEALIERYDIKWIKTNANLGKLHNQKAPFLAAIIKSIECFEGKNLIVKVILKDVSGEIQGTVIHSLYEEYSSSLVPGSVMVLRQCGVLTTSYSNNHYLTITARNLVTIYSKNNDEIVVIKVQQASCDDLIKEGKKQAPLKPQEESSAWQEALEGIDMDSFLEDF